MASLKGFAWNCGGLRASTALSRSKIMSFEKEFKTDFDIFFFVETHHRDESEIPKEHLRYGKTHHIMHTTVAENDTHTGITGLISKDFDITGTKHLCQGRMLNIKAYHKADQAKYNVTAVYLETSNHITKEKMQNTVHKLRLENENHSNNIILGDFNFIDHEKDKKWFEQHGQISVQNLATCHGRDRYSRPI